ncbi:MAG: chitobiase/beta-hexosaminidase C-terminal domain-containing protein [Bacteroidales bacterium]|jgi:exo-beta-1,3-glucanase (GH17 family)|nr:chitobiase/beta-hexosaminidase C-terminal domain-containing protein [Bacteroidales bacterium]
MKKISLLRNIVCLSAGMLLNTGIADFRAAENPEIVISYIPPLGAGGVAEGRVIWDGLTAANAGQYAVIAMLRSSWGSDYVKPFYGNYLNAIDGVGNFTISITTGGSDNDIADVSFYFVLRETFNGISGESVRASYMNDKYLGQFLAVNREAFWANRPQPPASSIRPGFADSGVSITLSCEEGGVIYYTRDGSEPAASASAQVYVGTAFVVPNSGSLLVKAVTEKSGSFSSPASFVWLPSEPLTTPFWGINVSLALNGEPFGYALSETDTRTRIAPIAPLTKWVRSFGTRSNGLEHVNKIAKEIGLRTMIGVYVTGNSNQNKDQLQGLRQILQTSPAPDLITVGNECSLDQAVTPAILAACIDSVRKIVKEFGLVIPVGSVDIADAAWSPSVLDKLDFVGVNIYSGTWDRTPENEMFNALKQTFARQLDLFPAKCVLLAETGTPYSGDSYDAEGVTQTPSIQKAAAYLAGFLDWIKADNIPACYFEAYDEPAKSQNGGHAIEQYFGIMDGNLQIHPFYENVIALHTAIPTLMQYIRPYPNPTAGIVFLEKESTIKIYDRKGVLLKETFGNQADLSDFPPQIYLLQAGKDYAKIIKRR